MKFFIKLEALFLVLFVLGFHLPAFAQTNFSKDSKAFVKIVDATNLPDFSTALPMNWCGENGMAGTNIPPTSMDGLPSEIFPGNLCPIAIMEHLQFIPQSNLELVQYYQYQGQLLENNLCSFWRPWEFDEFGWFHITLLWFADTFFVIRSRDEPDCEVVVWVRPQQIPMGRAVFPRCLN